MKSPIKMPPAWFYRLGQNFFNGLAAVLVRLEVRGREHLPKQGPCLVVFNHLSMVDAPVLLMSVPPQMSGYMTDKYAESPFIGRLAELFGVLWVKRGEADMNAIKSALGHLRSGGWFAISPEGTRSLTGQLQPGNSGAAYLATRAGVPIVPVVMTGTEKVFGALRRLRRVRVTLTVGEPFSLPLDPRAKGEKLEEYTELIMLRLAAMLPPEYRGVYANRV